MGVYDIRTQSTADIDEIIFAERDTTTQGFYKVEKYANDEIRLVGDGCSSIYLCFRDIDNAIAALQKARELWEV